MGLDDVVSTNKNVDLIESRIDEYEHDYNYEHNDFLDGLITGLIIGEGSFHIGISRADDGRTIPFYTYAEFKMNLGDYDKDAVLFLEDYMGVGNVVEINRKKSTENNLYRYKCTRIGDIQNAIIPWFNDAFDRVPVRTDKYDSYRIWRVVAKTKRDGRAASTEYLAKHTLMSAYAKDKVNQRSKGSNHTTYKEVKSALADIVPDVIDESEDDIKERIDEVVR